MIESVYSLLSDNTNDNIISWNPEDGYLTCNLYACIKKITSNDTYSAIKAVSNICDLDSIDCDTIITHAGDWGLVQHKKYGCILSGRECAFFTVDTESILNKFNNWFTPNLHKKIHDNIYPLPIGIKRSDWMGHDRPSIDILRSVPKDKPCYANFSITSTYRIKVAEWAAEQNYIDCLFPMVHEGQDAELKMSMLTEKKLTMGDFMRELATHKFCICPEGNGIDSYRMWECILTNTVPIAQNNYGNRIFAKIWPMILVNRYEMSDIPQLMEDFENTHGSSITYDYDLLLYKNFPQLLERIKDECKRS